MPPLKRTIPNHLEANPAASLQVDVVARLRELVQIVLQANQQFNLTAIRDPDDAWVRHILDSLQGLSTNLFEGGPSVVDVGAGAGFPGLALAVARPGLRVTLLESNRKKCSFMTEAGRQLGLDLAVLSERAEVAGHVAKHRENYDVATARAVGSFSEVCELGLPLVRVGGSLLLWRGPQGAAESAEAARALGLLGGQCVAVLPYRLSQLDALYHLITVHKVAPTPDCYPRRIGMPRRKPLA